MLTFLSALPAKLLLGSLQSSHASLSMGPSRCIIAQIFPSHRITSSAPCTVAVEKKQLHLPLPSLCSLGAAECPHIAQADLQGLLRVYKLQTNFCRRNAAPLGHHWCWAELVWCQAYSKIISIPTSIHDRSVGKTDVYWFSTLLGGTGASMAESPTLEDLKISRYRNSLQHQEEPKSGKLLLWPPSACAAQPCAPPSLPFRPSWSRKTRALRRTAASMR